MNVGERVVMYASVSFIHYKYDVHVAIGIESCRYHHCGGKMAANLTKLIISMSLHFTIIKYYSIVFKSEITKLKTKESLH